MNASGCRLACARWGSGQSSGVNVSATNYMVLTFRDGKIARYQEFYDEAQSTWVLKSSVAFVINGGRDEGYRGYSIFDGGLPGKWRVNVKNGGKLVGRITFTVESVSKAVETSIEAH